MSALPQAVQKQVKRANELAEKVLADRKAAEAPASTPTDGAPAAAAAPPVDGQPPALAPVAPAAAAPPPAEPPAAPAPAAPPPTPTPATDWEQRYRVLQGKYNAEVPRLTRQVQDVTTQMNNLQQQLIHTQGLLAALGQNRGTAPGTAQGSPAPSGGLIKDEEVKAFGADLIDVVRRAAQEEITKVVEPLRKEVERVPQIEKQVSGVATKVVMNDQQKFIAYLNEHAPEWRQLNEDEQFLDWLDQTDPFSGYTRIQLLKQAESSHDGPRAVAFFKAYQKENATVTPPAPASAPAPAAAATPKTLEDFVAPGAPKSGAGGAPNEAGKRIYTTAEIAAFYEAVRRGAYRKKPDEARQIERDIFAAQREGRVRP